MDTKPESIISSGYDPVKNEETDDEDMCKDTNTSNSQNHLLPITINIKEESNIKVKPEEDEASTDDEYTPEGLVSWLIGYNPVKREETDNEELGEDTNTLNDVSTDDENGSEMKIPGKQLVDFTTQSNASIREVQSTTKKRRYCRKRKVEESNAVQKTVECSVEGCTGKAADSGTCGAKHKGYKHCSQEGCINRALKGGVCTRHKEFAIDRMAGCTTCSVEGCTHKAADSGTCGAKHKGYNYCRQDGCTKRVQKGGVCVKHGAKRKTCKQQGCTKNAKKGGVCTKHGAKVKTCSIEGCNNQVQNRGVCIRHGAKVKPPKKCSHNGCTKYIQKEGLCRGHYNLRMGGGLKLLYDLSSTTKKTKY